MWTAEWNEIFVTNESRFYLQHHDGRIRVWRHRVERMLNESYAPPHSSCKGNMARGAIEYYSILVQKEDLDGISHSQLSKSS